ncbi:class I SAM-dependent methyltransferase [Candidatus Nomurabacteria bacterium]|nr:class I SAM-dependent methyltransferase [Candidatus Nomurabacteria bacterium]
MSNESANEKTLKYRKKAVQSHDMNSPVFYDRYTVLDENPYASAFAYGRKKLFEKMDAIFDEHLHGTGEVLEVACGTGYYLNHLSEKGYTMTGLEPAKGMRERAQAKNPNVKVIEGIATELPFPDNSFDAVVSIELFRYLEAADIKKAYEEILRVLKPGGIMVVTLVNRYALDAFQFSYQSKLLMEKVFGKEIINYCDSVTPAGMRAYFKKNFDQDAETASAMFAPLRILYKISPGVGEWFAHRLERFDERLNKKAWHQQFAGHLILTVKKK